MTRRGGEETIQPVIGIDISKDTLDAYRLSDDVHIQVSNDKLGHRALMRWIGQTDTSLIVFEATGAYHRELEARFAAADLPYAKVNPRQSRQFAEVTGRLAKTDRVDAIMLARMGAMLGLQRQEPASDTIVDLREFLAARRALMNDKVAAKTRLQTTTQDLLKRQINVRLKQIEVQISQIDETMSKMVMQDETLSQKLAILVSIPGIADVTAISMIVEMPELGALDWKKAASLAGLAPVSRQSREVARQGAHSGRSHIRAARSLYASSCSRSAKRSTESQVLPTDRGWKAAKTRSHSDHAPAHCTCKRPHPGPSAMVRNPTLTKTDTHLRFS